MGAVLMLATGALAQTATPTPTATATATPTPLPIQPSTLPSGQINTAYSQILSVASGGGTYTWSVSAGSLPGGITLSSDGSNQATLSGTASSASTSTFTLQVTDTAGDPLIRQQFDLTITTLTPNITWSNPADITYGTALSATQLNATADVPGTFSYNPPAGTILHGGTAVSLKATFTPTDTSTYGTATASVAINVLKADASMVVTDASANYNQASVSLKAAVSSTTAVNSGSVSFKVTDGGGKQLGAIATATSISNGSASATFSPRSIAVGTYTVTATFQGSTDFNTTSASGNLVVNQATPSITWPAPKSIPYGTALSKAQLNAASPAAGTFTYTPAAGTILDVGTQTLSVSFTPSDTTNYLSNSATVTIEVTKAKPVLDMATTTNPNARVTWLATYGDASVTFSVHLASSAAVNDGSVTFTVKRGQDTLGSVSATVSASDAEASFPLTGLNAGTYAVAATYSGGSSFTAASNTAALRIAKANPTVTWPSPADIVYGTALSETQLNSQVTAGSNPLSGTLSYGPAAGRVLLPGNGQKLTMTFRPADPTNFNTVRSTVLINVSRAPTSLFASDVTATAKQRSASLVAHVASTATVSAGTVNFTVTSSSVTVASVSARVSGGVARGALSLSGLPPGSYQVSATYAGSNRFKGSTGSATLTIS